MKLLHIRRLSPYYIDIRRLEAPSAICAHSASLKGSFPVKNNVNRVAVRVPIPKMTSIDFIKFQIVLHEYIALLVYIVSYHLWLNALLITKCLTINRFRHSIADKFPGRLYMQPWVVFNRWSSYENDDFKETAYQRILQDWNIVDFDTSRSILNYRNFAGNILMMHVSISKILVFCFEFHSFLHKCVMGNKRKSQNK